MEAISLLLEASEAQDARDDFVLDYAARVGAKRLPEHSNTDIEAVDAILHLRGDSFDSTIPSRWPSSNMRLSPAPIGDIEKEGKLGHRRRRAMSEPWVTMSSPSLRRSEDEKLNLTQHAAPFHPVLLQPRFPQPLMAIQTQPQQPGMPHRMPTIEEFAPICNQNGRIGIYTKEEREVLIHRFREKKKRRIWKKKIRYECRKDLADRRTRVKGRFVKAVSTPATVSSLSASAAKTAKSTMGIKSRTAILGKPSLVLTFKASGSLSSDNTSEETNDSLDHQPPLTFHLPSSKTESVKSPDRIMIRREVKPLQLDKYTTSEDRLKYLASILGGETSDSFSPEDEDDYEDDDEEELEEELEDEEGEEVPEDEEGLEQQKQRMDVDAMDTSNPDGPSTRHRRRRSGSEVDYHRHRRHSIAY